MRTTMRKFVRAGIVLVTIAGANAMGASPTYSQAEAERYIQQSEAAWSESVATNDASVVTRILADDVVWVLDGKILDKAQAVKNAANGPYHFASAHLDYAHVRFFGEVAVVQGSETLTEKDGSKSHSVWIDTWVHRNGQWQIVAAEDVTVPVKQ